MNRTEIIRRFRTENPEIPERVITDPLLHDWCLDGDKEVCAITRCIVDQDGTEITTVEDDEYYDLITQITNFYDIDEYPGGGVTYNDKRIDKTSIAELDFKSPNWRNRDSGTPKAYYRRGKFLYLDRPVDSNVYTLKVYAVLISNDFDDDDKTPYNQLSYLEPFHNGINKYLQWKAKEQIGKEGSKARGEFVNYTTWMKSEIGGGKFSAIQFTKDESYG